MQADRQHHRGPEVKWKNERKKNFYAEWENKLKWFPILFNAACFALCPPRPHPPVSTGTGMCTSIRVSHDFVMAFSDGVYDLFGCRRRARDTLAIQMALFVLVDEWFRVFVLFDAPTQYEYEPIPSREAEYHGKDRSITNTMCV